MAWHQRLRYRLIGIQLLVVTIGVVVMLVTMRFVVLNRILHEMRPVLASNLDAVTFADVETTLRVSLQSGALFSGGIAAIGALLTGAIASFVLWRTIVSPLRNLAVSSQHIANGNYTERVPFPARSGEAMQQLATNFNQMAQALAQVEKQRVNIISNVAHELRTPLAGLQGMVEGLEDGVFAPDQETFGMMTNEIGRLSRLVEDIQNLARAESGTAEFTLETFALGDVVQRVSTSLQLNAKEKGVQLQTNATATDIEVYADVDRTAQILTNLIGNAICFTPDGGEIQLVLSLTDKAAQVDVIDTGLGIAATDLPYIFERFYRADRSRSRKSGGSGIGLTISRYLARGMQGSLTAESAGLGHGSVFTLRLPKGQ